MKPRHPGASRDPEPQPQPPFSWIPAYAGMTPLRQKNSVTEPLVARPFCFADNRSRSGAVQRRVVKAMTEPVAFKYRAFISYSHADTAWAKWLHRALEIFHHRQGPRRARDGDGHDPQNADAHLPRPRRLHRGPYAHQTRHSPRSTPRPLSSSSARPPPPRATTSMRRSGSSSRGIPKGQSSRSSSAASPAMPSSNASRLRSSSSSTLKDKITNDPVELLAADAREEGDGKSLALAKVVAGLLGVSSDDIFRRAERERAPQGQLDRGTVRRRRCSRASPLGRDQRARREAVAQRKANEAVSRSPS